MWNTSAGVTGRFSFMKLFVTFLYFETTGVDMKKYKLDFRSGYVAIALILYSSVASANGLLGSFGGLLSGLGIKNDIGGHPVVVVSNKKQAEISTLREMVKEKKFQELAYKGQARRILYVIGRDSGRAMTFFVNNKAVLSKLEIKVRFIRAVSLRSTEKKFVWNDSGATYALNMQSVSIICNARMTTCNSLNNAPAWVGPTHTAAKIASVIASNLGSTSNLTTTQLLNRLSFVAQPGLYGPRHLYIFFDPDCAACRYEFMHVQDNSKEYAGRYKHLAKDWVPTDLFAGIKSSGRAEQCIRYGFASMKTDFQDFNGGSETGGLPSKEIHTEKDRLTYNDAVAVILFSRFGLKTWSPGTFIQGGGVPELFFISDKDPNVHYFGVGAQGASLFSQLNDAAY